jgi:hypothetical protein
MRGLQSLREGWDEVEAAETQLLRDMSVQESLAQWLRLQHAFEYQLQQTEELFAPDRRQALGELQFRLHRLAEWQRNHGESVSLDPGAPAPAE